MKPNRLLKFFLDYPLTSSVVHKSYHVLHKSVLIPIVTKGVRTKAVVFSRGPMCEIIEGSSVLLPMISQTDIYLDDAIKQITQYSDMHGEKDGPWELQIFIGEDFFGILLMEIRRP